MHTCKPLNQYFGAPFWKHWFQALFKPLNHSTNATLLDTCFETNCMVRNRCQALKHAKKQINWCEIDAKYYVLVLRIMVFKFGLLGPISGSIVLKHPLND